ncbi:hypothetical protein ABT311_12995, partial [Saccharopolyspora hirsuta]
MMPPVSPPTPGGAGGERSDSSGLLDVGDEPWSGVGTPPAVGDPHAPGGALPAVPDLGVPSAETPGAGTPVTETPGVETPGAELPGSEVPTEQSWSPGDLPAGQGGGLDQRGGVPPMMPPVSPPTPGGAGGERSDSSGLLDVGDEPWSGVGTPPAV